jgi:hypothetical protein
VKINLSYDNSEHIQISLDLDLETQLSSLISYFKNFSKENNSEKYNNLIVLDSDQEILSPNCRIVELVLLNPSKYRNLNIRLGSSIKRGNLQNFSNQQNLQNFSNFQENTYKDYESKPKYTPHSHQANENNFNYKSYLNEKEYTGNDIGASAYNYRNESKDYKEYKEYKNDNEENVSITNTNTNNISRDRDRDRDRERDYSYYNKYLNKDLGTENFYNTTSANYTSKNEVKSPMNGKFTKDKERERVYSSENIGNIGNGDKNEYNINIHTPGAGTNNYYDSKYGMPSSPTHQNEFEEANTNSNNNTSVKLARFQSEKRIYRDEGRVTKGEKSYPRETVGGGVEKKPRDEDINVSRDKERESGKIQKSNKSKKKKFNFFIFRYPSLFSC